MVKLIGAALAGLIVGVAAGYMGAGGCNTGAGKPVAAAVAQTAPSATADSESVKYRPILDGIVSGLLTKDYNLFTRDFQPEIKAMLPESKFKEAAAGVENPHGGLGKPVYLGTYNKGGTIITLWKAKGLKTGEDILLTLSLIDIDGKYKVIGFYLQ